MRLANATDHALLLHWQNHGDPAAFAALVDRHAAMVHSASMRVVRNRALAQEVAQDSFLKLTQLERFNGESLGGWLHRVATNRALDIAKSESRRHTRETAYEESRETPAPSSESIAVLAEIDAALNALPDDLRELVVLHYLEGATHKEIARRTDTSRATVTRNIHRALDQLREQLGARSVVAGSALVLATLESARAAAASESLVASLRKLALHAPARVLPGATTTASLPLLAVGAAVVLLALFGVYLAPRLRSAPPAIPVAPARLGAAATAATTPPASPAQPARMAAQVQTAEPVASTSAVAPASSLSGSILLKCVDTANAPVSGAEVYVIRDAIRSKPGLIGRSPDDIPSAVYGPFESDANGRVDLTTLDLGPAGEGVFFRAYGRVPNKLVGSGGLGGPGPRKKDEWSTLILVPSRAIDGIVTVPRDYDATKVLVAPTLLVTRTGGLPYGNMLGRPEDLDTFPIPALAGRHPDSQGRVHIDDVPVAGSMAFAATAPGLAERRLQLGDQDPSEKLNFEMIAESAIFGTVRYRSTGAPLPNVTVWARPLGLRDTSGNTMPFSARTDALGRYHIPALYAEQYRVLAFPIGNPPEWAAPVICKVDVGLSQQTGPIDLYFNHGEWVEGIAREKESGAPIDGVVIRAVNPDTDGMNAGEALDYQVTAGGGYYRVYLPIGASMLYISEVPQGYPHPSDQGRKKVMIEPNAHTPMRVDFELGAPKPVETLGLATYTGHVKDASGRPLKGVPIYDNTKEKQEERWPTRWLLGRTADDGTFHFSSVASGSHQIEIGGGNGSPMPRAGLRFSSVLKDEIKPEANKTYDLGETIVEEYTRSLGGRVLDEFGAPLAQAEIYLEAEIPGFPGASAITDDHGSFTLQYIPKGAFRLRAYLNGYEESSVDAEPGFNYELTLKRTKENATEPAN